MGHVDAEISPTVNAEALVTELLRKQREQRYPPVNAWHPDRSGAIDIDIRSDGTWWHEGGQIKRPGLIKVLASVLRRDGDDYYLVTPAEKLMIRVADVPLVAVDLDIAGAGTAAQQLVITTNTGDIVLVDADHPIWVEDAMTNPRPYVRVRDNLDARLTRSVFYRLVDAATLDDQQLEILSAGVRYPLGDALDR